jgi:hypothetical protein
LAGAAVESDLSELSDAPLFFGDFEEEEELLEQ